jgi:hypothetical protein
MTDANKDTTMDSGKQPDSAPDTTSSLREWLSHLPPGGTLKVELPPLKK